MIGMLVTLACIVILFAISMTALNKAVTGGGSPKEGTVRSTKDLLNLQAIHLALSVEAGDYNGTFITPSVIVASQGGGESRRLRPSDILDHHHLDTSANMWSALVMTNSAQPKQLISANEYSGYVDEYYSYNYDAYDPIAGVYWDPQFVADLHQLSYVSFAHVPLHGKRYESNWNTAGSATFPIFGNRGPENGIDNPKSRTYGRDGAWGGHLVFPDGHIDFVTSFTPSNVHSPGAAAGTDNIFAVQNGPAGDDAILSFTKEMTESGPVLQFD